MYVPDPLLQVSFSYLLFYITSTYAQVIASYYFKMEFATTTKMLRIVPGTDGSIGIEQVQVLVIYFTSTYSQVIAVIILKCAAFDNGEDVVFGTFHYFFLVTLLTVSVFTLAYYF